MQRQTMPRRSTAAATAAAATMTQPSYPPAMTKTKPQVSNLVPPWFKFKTIDAAQVPVGPTSHFACWWQVTF